MNWSVESIRQELETRLKSLTGWANIIFYGTISNILYAFSYIISKIAYYLDFVYRESTWANMTIRESALDRCDILGYYPHRRKGSIGTIEISGSSTFSNSFMYSGKQVFIDRWTIFSDESNEYSVYATDSNAYSTNYVGSIFIPVKEGVPKSFSYVALGNENEVITLYSNSIDEDEIYVYLVDSNNEVLQQFTVYQKNKMYFLNDPTAYACEVINSRDYESVMIKFGDDIHSRKLSVGDRILIRYAETKGREVSVNNIGSISKFQDEISDIYGNPVNLYIRNSTPISGGLDIESLEEIKINAPDIFSTINGINTSGQYKTLLLRSGLVLKTVVWTIDDLGTPDLPADMNKVFVAGISPVSKVNLTVEEQTNITLNVLKDKKSPIEIITWQPATILYPRIIINAKVLSRPFSEIQTDTLSALEELFGIENTDFNTSIYDSDVIQALKSIPAVRVVEPDLFYLERSWSSSESERVITVSNTTGADEDKVLLVNNSVSLWLKRKIMNVWQAPIQIAQSVSTFINGMNGFTISGGLINYSENKITYLVNELSDIGTYGVPDPDETIPTGYILYVSYQTQDGTGAFTNSLRVNNFKTITDLDTDFISYSLSYTNK